MADLDLNTLHTTLIDRAKAQGWVNANGKWTKAGERAASEFLVGAAAAAAAVGARSPRLEMVLFVGFARSNVVGEFERVISCRR